MGRAAASAMADKASQASGRWAVHHVRTRGTVVKSCREAGATGTRRHTSARDSGDGPATAAPGYGHEGNRTMRCGDIESATPRLVPLSDQLGCQSHRQDEFAKASSVQTTSPLVNAICMQLPCRAAGIQ